jgi:hypothetical protein
LLGSGGALRPVPLASKRFAAVIAEIFGCRSATA